jgi:hypothetical protein
MIVDFVTITPRVVGGVGMTGHGELIGELIARRCSVTNETIELSWPYSALGDVCVHNSKQCRAPKQSVHVPQPVFCRLGHLLMHACTGNAITTTPSITSSFPLSQGWVGNPPVTAFPSAAKLGNRHVKRQDSAGQSRASLSLTRRKAKLIVLLLQGPALSPHRHSLIFTSPYALSSLSCEPAVLFPRSGPFPLCIRDDIILLHTRQDARSCPSLALPSLGRISLA